MTTRPSVMRQMATGINAPPERREAVMQWVALRCTPDDYLVGPRYSGNDLRVGQGPTFVLEAGAGVNRGGWAGRKPVQIPTPIAGPIGRHPLWGKWIAGCSSCGEHSKLYARKNEPSLFRWAYNHRCPS